MQYKIFKFINATKYIFLVSLIFSASLLPIFYSVKQVDATWGNCPPPQTSSYLEVSDDSGTVLGSYQNMGLSDESSFSLVISSGTVLHFNARSAGVIPDSSTGTSQSSNLPVTIISPNDIAGYYPSGYFFSHKQFLNGVTDPLYQGGSITVSGLNNCDPSAGNSDMGESNVFLTIVVDSSFSCYIQTQSQTIAKGSSGTYTVQVTGSSSVTGATTLTLDNPPVGVSSSGATATIPASAPYQTMAGLPVAVDASATAGPTNIAITATNGSQTKQCGSAQLDITESRDFSLAVSPAAQTAQVPNNLDYSVHAYCSGGFAAPITFTSVNHTFTNVTTAFYPDSLGSNPIDRVACGQTVILRLTATAQSWPLNTAMPVSVTGKEVQ